MPRNVDQIILIAAERIGDLGQRPLIPLLAIDADHIIAGQDTHVGSFRTLEHIDRITRAIDLAEQYADARTRRRDAIQIRLVARCIEITGIRIVHGLDERIERSCGSRVQIVRVDTVVLDDTLHFGNTCRKRIIGIARDGLSRVDLLLHGKVRKPERGEQVAVTTNEKARNKDQNDRNANTNDLDDVRIALLNGSILFLIGRIHRTPDPWSGITP